MSDSTPTEFQRILKSPFNGQPWVVPPEVSDEMYAALLARGFKEIPQTKPKRKEDNKP